MGGGGGGGANWRTTRIKCNLVKRVVPQVVGGGGGEGDHPYTLREKSYLAVPQVEPLTVL